MIVITPTAGLCNRMRSLDSALALGRAAAVSVRMVWQLNVDVHCAFEELFDPIPGLESIDTVEVEKTAGPPERMTNLRAMAKRLGPLKGLVKKVRTVRKSFGRTIEKLKGGARILGYDDIKLFAAHPEELVALARSHDLFIETFSRFFRGDEDYAGFQPAAEIQETVDRFSLRSRNVVGVHLRRQTPELWLSHSPTEDFIISMQNASRSDETVEFFVASDSLETELEIEEAFPGRIIRQPKDSYSRENPVGIRHAMVDLYCLASCRRLIGTYGSSFTATAQELGRIPCEIIDRKEI